MATSGSVRFSRRRWLQHLGALAFIAAARRPRAAEAIAVVAQPDAAARRIVPFAPGDVAVGCTLLNSSTDDHRGQGRILHFSGALQLKNTIVFDDTTHIVEGLKFAPDKSLWAFDCFAYKIARVAASGRRLPNFAAPARSFACIDWAADGSFYLGEKLVGSKSKLPLHTTLPFMPGTQRFGDGHLFKFSRKGKLLKEYATPVHGGMVGFQGLTSCALATDNKSLYYTSESGPRLMHYDLVEGKPLPDVLAFAENTNSFFFDVQVDRDSRLLAVRGARVEALDAAGMLLQTYPLAGFGWASMSKPVTDSHFYVTNFFSGEIAKIDLKTGAVLASALTGAHKSLSGPAEFPG